MNILFLFKIQYEHIWQQVQGHDVHNRWDKIKNNNTNSVQKITHAKFQPEKLIINYNNNNNHATKNK